MLAEGDAEDTLPPTQDLLDHFIADLRSPQYFDQIINIMGTHDISSHSIWFDMMEYSDENPFLHHLILTKPLEILSILEVAVRNLQEEIMGSHHLAHALSVKPNVHVRCMRKLGSVPNHCKDYQEIKVQEQITKLSFGTIPRSITVVLEDDITDSCKAGDDITVVGIGILRFKPMTETKRVDSEVVIVANSIEVNNDQTGHSLLTDELKAEFKQFWESHSDRPMAARDHILKSFCPSVIGIGLKLRGDAHLLLVGDPGTGKSQFLRYASLLTSRAILTTGIGSTSAGLTVSAVKDSGEWQLEAGALVLADRVWGIRETDKTAIHEAMEQQTISVAKVWMGKYDFSLGLEVNVGLGSPLLSRFDLILVLLDNQNDEWDMQLSSFILGLESDVAEDVEEVTEKEAKIWDFGRLQAYIKYVKANCNAELSDEASVILQRYYTVQRNSDSRNAARTTVRLLESLIRLTQAHARLMCKSVAGVQDAVSAVLLMELSMNASGLASGQSPLHAPFPENPEAFYGQQELELLKKMNLAHLISDDDDGGSSQYSQQSRLGRAKRGMQTGSSSSPYEGTAAALAALDEDADDDEEGREDGNGNVVGISGAARGSGAPRESGWDEEVPLLKKRRH
ncbi:MCM2/3/5 family-domain-containing protein [Chytridium lagenaria]|nr:MCM2/3/5 family-domain-containing protein [Chytridium lagenaria]